MLKYKIAFDGGKSIEGDGWVTAVYETRMYGGVRGTPVGVQCLWATCSIPCWFYLYNLIPDSLNLPKIYPILSEF